MARRTATEAVRCSRVPHRPVGDVGLGIAPADLSIAGRRAYELRFDLDRQAFRLTYYFAAGRRIVLLTAFRKQRMNERHEVNRARDAMVRCIREGHTAEEDDE